MSTQSFDAVVIGSGLGGLTAAALMAKAGRKVCVIERNHSVGGAASVFKKGALTIEPALHQTADPRDPREPKHEILKELGLLDEIEWIPVSPFFSVRGGPVGETFELPVGFEAAREAMARRFPASRAGSDRLLALMERMQAGVADLSRARDEHSLGRLLRGALELRSLIGDWRASLDDVLTRTLGATRRPSSASPAISAIMPTIRAACGGCFSRWRRADSSSVGGVFIKGGSRTLSMKLAKVVTKAGGAVLLGREAIGVELDAAGRAAFVRHVNPKTPEAVERVGAKVVLANCAPDVLAGLLGAPQRGAVERAYGARAVSTSLFSAHFGVNAPPATFGLQGFGSMALPGWMASLRQTAESATLLGADPGARLPAYGVVNYGAIDSGVSDGGPTLVSVVGLDLLSNWAALTPQQDKDRRERWLDAFQGALERDYPGLGGAVVERLFLSARSMRNFLNTPDGAVYGFAPTPPRRGVWAGLPRSPRTPVAGLYLASSFGGSGGFTGAMVSGAQAARMAMRERG